MWNPQLNRATRSRLRPRYAGANIRTWIGFKQFMNLAEEAVLNWFRERGCGPQEVYHRYGAEWEIVDSSVQLPAVLEIDDELDAEVVWREPGHFRVRLSVVRDGAAVTVLRGRVTVALVTAATAAAGTPPPAWLAPLVVPGVSAAAEPPEPPEPPEPFGWQWQARYFHCHFSDRVQHGSYVQALEEVVDRFLADRGLPVPRLLAERGWIPVVSRARVRLLTDAHLDEQIRTTFAVTDLVKDRGFDGRMDSYVVGPPGSSGSDPPTRVRHVATARILHGYAVAAGEGAGGLAVLDPQTTEALAREAS